MQKVKELTDLKPLCRGLAKLIIVDIALSRDQDNPQLIFESMNSTGRALSQADLIRNFVLMNLEPAQQTQLYEYYWRPMEVAFGQESYGEHFDWFMRHYLTVRTGDLPRISDVYEASRPLPGSLNKRQPGWMRWSPTFMPSVVITALWRWGKSPTRR